MSAPTSSIISYIGLVDKLEPDRYEQPDGYVFANNRIFKSTDKDYGGIYDTTFEYKFDFLLA